MQTIAARSYDFVTPPHVMVVAFGGGRQKASRPPFFNPAGGTQKWRLPWFGRAEKREGAADQILGECCRACEASSVDRLSVGVFVGVVADPGSKPTHSNII